MIFWVESYYKVVSHGPLLDCPSELTIIGLGGGGLLMLEMEPNLNSNLEGLSCASRGIVSERGPTWTTAGR